MMGHMESEILANLEVMDHHIYMFKLMLVSIKLVSSKMNYKNNQKAQIKMSYNYYNMNSQLTVKISFFSKSKFKIKDILTLALLILPDKLKTI